MPSQSLLLCWLFIVLLYYTDLPKYTEIALFNRLFIFPLRLTGRDFALPCLPLGRNTTGYF
nr:MAG TPA: hypothetical protein [Caudoviricetes sp.]DAO72125.1 MAG TPA: hypothetical protein [Caudoviricetes sp.]